MTVLVAFVHGLRADARDFWGSTPEAVESHNRRRRTRLSSFGAKRRPPDAVGAEDYI